MSVSSQRQHVLRPAAWELHPPGGRFTHHHRERSTRLSRDNNPGGVLFNSVQVTRADGQTISLMSFNAPQEKQVEHTRAKPY